MKITERERFRRCVLMEYAKFCYLGNVMEMMTKERYKLVIKVIIYIGNITEDTTTRH